MITLREAELVLVSLPLVRPFKTSFGVQETRDAVLLRVVVSDEGAEAEGWGECVAGREPLYSSEWALGAWLLLQHVLVPMAAASPFESLRSIRDAFVAVKGNPMTKATLEMAVVDATLRARGVSVASSLGGVRDRIECGVSIGMVSSTGALLDQVAGYLDEGYRRIKLKIEPGHDVVPVSAVRERFPSVMLTVDANAAYTPGAPALAHLDTFGLAMIEQPFGEDALSDHAALAASLATPVCLDESITSVARAVSALDARACSIINIKQGRVGGLAEAVDVAALCATRGIPVWCGGMLETGIGRAANIALASLPAFTLPGDTSASSRYFHEDLTEPFVMDADGTIAVPAGPGLGVAPIPSVLDRVTLRRERISW